MSDSNIKFRLTASDETQQAFNSAKRNLESIRTAGESVKRGLEAVGLALGVKEVVEFGKSIIDLGDEMNDMATRTGVSVKTLASYKLAAEQSGTALESVAKGINKMTLSIGQAEQGNKEIGKSLVNLGITAKDPQKAFEQLADAVAKSNDPTRLAADLQKILGKNYSELLPLLKEGSDYLRESADASASFAEQMAKLAPNADKFNDQLAQIKLNSAGVSVGLLNDLIPSLNDTAKAMIRLQQEGHGVEALLRGFAGIGKLPWDLAFGDGGVGAADTAKAHIADLKKQLEEVQGKLKIAGGGGLINEFFFGKPGDLQRQATVLQNQIAAYEKFGDKVFAKPQAPAKAAANPGPIKLPIDQDVFKKNLYNQLKSLEGLAAKEGDILASRNKILDAYNAANLLSFHDYFAGKKAAQDDALKNTLADYDREIAALEVYRSKTSKQVDKLDATGKINDLLAKKSKLQQDAAVSGIADSIAEQKSLEDLRKSFSNVNMQVLEFTGNLHEAAIIRFDSQNDSLRKRFSAEGNQAALAQLDTLKKYAVAQADINSLSQQAGIINDQLANTESRINIAQQAGALGELGALDKVSAARKDAVVKLDAIYQAQMKVALASGNPKLIQDAENFRTTIEKLAAESDLVAQKINSVFTDAAGNAFADFVTGAKSAKDAFKEFSTSIATEISKMASQELAKKLFGSLFDTKSGGSTGASAGGSGWAGAALNLLGSLFKSANGNVFMNSPGLAAYSGTVVDTPTVFPFASGMGLMGEAGPEAILPLKRGSDGKLGVQTGGGGPVVVNMNISTPDANSFRASQGQIVAQMGRALQRGRRNL